MWIVLTILSILSLSQGMIKDISFEVVENCPVGTVVGNIKISAELFHFKHVELSLENGDHFDDQFGKDQKTNNNLFSIEDKTGNLLTMRDIDREAICAKQNCTILRIVSVNRLKWINVYIRIIDVNDNPPEFRQPEVTLTLSEISKIYSTIQLDEAADLDSAQFGPLKYSLQQQPPNDVQFQLQHDPLKLVLLKSLDYETMQRYNMVLIACDNGVPSLCGNQTLHIDVINENDEAPVFLRSNYTAIINEDAPIGQLVLQPRAFDRDLGEYGKVKYSISSGYDLAKNHFSINVNNGNLIIKERFRNPTKLKFSIEAKDQAPNPLIGRTWIFLHIVDVNNHFPIVQVNPIDAILLERSVNDTTLEIGENNRVPLNLAFITVTDGDQGENARCMCQLHTQNEHIQLLNVNDISERNIYRLATNTVFDAETIQTTNVQINCYDHGEPQNSVIHGIELKIRDENEYYPSFDQSLYEIEVMENCSIGTVVKQIKVYDRDIQQSISLDLTTPGSLFFEINGSGVISTKSTFDYEKVKKIEFLVTATDRGIRSHTSSARVSALIIDVNDNSPQFQNNSNHVEVFENMKGTYKAGKIIAYDRDSAINAQLIYYLLNASCDSNKNVDTTNLFFLDQSTGDIHSNVSLDYEQCSLYIILVKVIDSGNPPLSNVQSFFVHIKDLNDNGPQWVYPNKEDNILNISLVNIRDSILTRVRATDMDGDQYNTVHYYLMNHNEKVSIDKVTGVITLQSKTPLYRGISLLLKAVDAKSSDKYSSQNLIVHIENDDRTFATISSFNLTFPVLISIIGISSLVSIVLVIALFFFCCRKRRICRNCVRSHEPIESKYDCRDLKTLDENKKIVDIPLDLVTDNDGFNNSIVEDSVKLIFSSLCPSSNSFRADNKDEYDPFEKLNQDVFQRNSMDAQPNDSDFFRYPAALINLNYPYSSYKECCAVHSSSDEDSNRYIEHIDQRQSRSIQLLQAVDPTDCMINSYATFVKCGCDVPSTTITLKHPSATKPITAPFIFNGSAWIPTESLTSDSFIMETKRDNARMMPLKSIMKKTQSPFINLDSSSSSGQCNDTDQTSSVYDSGCIVGVSDTRSQPQKSISLIDKTYHCKKSQV